MEYLYPDYYRKFKCIADKCEDTCCAGWQIMIDPKSMSKYRKLKGKYKKTLLGNIDFKEGSFKQSCDGRCAFLNNKNLCEMYINAGEDKLCKTCRRYPRHFEEFENFRTVNLSISCPEVARIILGNKNKVQFKYISSDKEEEQYEEFDFMLFTKLSQIQEYVISVLQNRTLDISTRVGIILGTVSDMQRRIDNYELFEIDDMLVRYESEEFRQKTISALNGLWDNASRTKCYSDTARLFMNMHKLEVLKQEWPEKMAQCEETLYMDGIDGYIQKKQEFNKYMQDRMVEYEQILVYFVATYMLGAVYDAKVYDKIVFAVASYMFVREMGCATYLLNGKSFTFENQVEIVYKFSRELEHSSENVELFEDMISKEKIYEALNLIKSIAI